MTPPSAIFAATVNGDLFALKRLMATADATSVNAVTVINKGVYTPLSRAAELGRQDVVRQLLSHPRINVARPPGMPPATPTALHRAAASGHESIVSLLLAHPGININAVAERDRVTAIELALSNSHWAIVHMLWPVVNDDSRYKCFDNALGMRRYEHAAALLGLPSSWQCDLTFRGRLVVEYLAPYLSVECLVALLIRDLPVGVHPTAPSQLVDVPDHSFSWMEFLAPDMTLPDDVAKPTVVRAILDHPTFKQVPRSDLVRRLMTARDRHDRPAINAADTDIRDYMTGELYFLGRYELLDGPPVHVSATAVVVLAYDHGICSQVFDEFADDEGLLDLNGFVECSLTLGRLQTGPRSTHQPGAQACERWESEFEIWDVDSDDVLTKDEYQRYCDQTFGNKLRVALKFMKHESDWAREVWTRRGLDSKYVLGLLPSHVPADCADHIAQLQLSSMSNVTMALFRHMIVLPAADRSLEDVFQKAQRCSR
ncbi:hypothetical protein H310_12493 [Aphanomyces invadans]|uniref:Uncharacterized protein n=1 Tax=Aphanomyces invadans TaxID=157072 RepID=A0A024TJE5_9STRA|nr:hypothetical protein H310_12493 [Aphanomyces invadans]ETV93432.1 hypothetical protein H310_12493 [Aphanomyces invadans]|eukprot:XP_008877774.1 hypothetical protein H310_12493 [Aphanomyces invadans]